MSKAKRSARRKGATIADSSQRSWFLGLSLLAAITLAYWPALNGGPIWDDDAHLTRHELQSSGGLGQMWTHLGSTRQYYPIVHSCFWLENRVWGHAVFPYHLINVLLHAASALLLVRILHKLRIPGAWLAGAIFALHPVQVESVAWISELKNTLSGFLCLAALLAYLKFDQRRDLLSYFGALSLFVLGLLSKSVIATLPAVLLVVFWWRKGKLSWKADLRPLLPFFVAGISSGLFTAWVERRLIGAEGQSFDLSVIERCLIAGHVFWFYLFKLFWPEKLTFVYPRWQIDAGLWWQYLFPIAAMAAVVTLWFWRKRSRAPLAAVLIFGGTLFPVLGFVNVYPFIFSFVADHFQYLACVGIIALVAAGFSLLLERYAAANRMVIYSSQVTLLLLLATLTWRQAGTYRDAETLYQTTLERNPGCWMAHDNLGVDLFERGQIAESIEHFQEAIAIDPQHAESYTNLGNAYMVQGRNSEAMQQYEKTLALAPRAVQAKNNLAWLLATSRDASLRDPPRAVHLAEEAVEISQGNDPVILRTLAAAYAGSGRYVEASATAEKGLQLAADNEGFANKLRADAKAYQAHLPTSH